MALPKTCKTRDLAQLLGISDRRVRQLVDEKVLTQKSRDTFEMAPNVKAYIAFREHAVASESGRYHGLSKERAGMVRVQRELAEIERDQVLGRVVEIEEAKAIIARCLLVVKNKMLRLGSKVAPLVAPASPHTAEKIIYNETCEILSELSELAAYGEPQEPQPVAATN